MVLVDRPVQDGDTVLLDYAGYVGEEQFEGGTAERYPLKIGSGTFIPGFEEQIVGAKAGDDVDVKVTFPEEYHAENLAGAEAVFKCKIHEVKEEEVPEVDDEFVKDVSECDTLDEFKAQIRENLEKAAKANAEMEMKNAVLEKVRRRVPKRSRVPLAVAVAVAASPSRDPTNPVPNVTGVIPVMSATSVRPVPTVSMMRMKVRPLPVAVAVAATSPSRAPKTISR